MAYKRIRKRPYSRNAGVASEHKECKAFFDWYSLYPFVSSRMIRIENGGKRSLTEAVRLKSEGLTPGTPDYFFRYPCGGYHGLWIEVKKTKGGKVSPEQINFIENARKEGYAAEIGYGWEECRQIVLDYIKRGTL